MTRNRAMASVMLLAVTLLLAAPSVILATEEKPDILSPRFDLTIWTIVVFALLYIVLRFVKLPGAPAPAWVAMLDGLKKREESIHSALDEAEKARAETARLVAQFEADRQKANEEAGKIVAEASQAAQRNADGMIAKAKADIQAERERLKREMELARDQAIKELWEQTAALATLVSSKVVGRQMNLEDHRRVVEEGLTEMHRSASDLLRAN